MQISPKGIDAATALTISMERIRSLTWERLRDLYLDIEQMAKTGAISLDLSIPMPSSETQSHFVHSIECIESELSKLGYAVSKRMYLEKVSYDDRSHCDLTINWGRK